MTSERFVAELEVDFVHASGERVPGRIAVGAPVEDDRSWACAVEVGRHGPRPIYGTDGMQALLLAIQVIGFELHTFRERGGRIVEPGTNNDLPLHAYFGPLLRASDA